MRLVSADNIPCLRSVPVGCELVTSFHQAVSSLLHASDIIQLAEALERVSVCLPVCLY